MMSGSGSHRPLRFPATGNSGVPSSNPGLEALALPFQGVVRLTVLSVQVLRPSPFRILLSERLDIS